MDIRIVDLDGSLPPQQELLSRHHPAVFDARAWGPDIRLACSFGRFGRFDWGVSSR